MNTDLIKRDLDLKKGKTLNFRYNKTRNQIEEFKGTIENTYSKIFVIRDLDNPQQVKTFCYSDVLTNHLEILPKKV
ncbi:MAG: Veg family protein [Bacilli bacterium]|nr:Veg family protein [Bacilli bacterium]MBQ3468896.1 Veg family protein [Bacilli bacterium]